MIQLGSPALSVLAGLEDVDERLHLQEMPLLGGGQDGTLAELDVRVEETIVVYAVCVVNGYSLCWG